MRVLALMLLLSVATIGAGGLAIAGPPPIEEEDPPMDSDGTSIPRWVIFPINEGDEEEGPDE